MLVERICAEAEKCPLYRIISLMAIIHIVLKTAGNIDTPAVVILDTLPPYLPSTSPLNRFTFKFYFNQPNSTTKIFFGCKNRLHSG